MPVIGVRVCILGDGNEAPHAKANGAKLYRDPKLRANAEIGHLPPGLGTDKPG